MGDQKSSSTRYGTCKCGRSIVNEGRGWYHQAGQRPPVGHFPEPQAGHFPEPQAVTR